MPDEQGNETSEDSNAKEDVYVGPKSRPKIVRVLTVLAYVLSVSMAAILLSVYYIFMWDGQPTLASRKSSPQFENFEPGVPTHHQKLTEIYDDSIMKENARINTTDADEFDRLLKRIILSGNATSGSKFRSLPLEIAAEEENLNATATGQTAEKRKQPTSTSDYDDNSPTTTMTEDMNTENQVASANLKELGRKSLLYKKLLRRRLL